MKNPFDSLTGPEEVTIEVICPDIPFARIKKFAAHFSCNAKKGVGGYVTFSTSDASNLYWLGANMNNGALNSQLNPGSLSKFIAP